MASRGTPVLSRTLPGPRSGRPLSRATKPLLGIADQAVSSGTNLAATVLIARNATPVVFGAWGLVNALYILEISLIRGAIVGPYMVRYREGRTSEDRNAVGAAVSVGLALSVTHLLAASLIGGPIGRLLVVYAFLTTGLLAQESARRMLYAKDRARTALESNLAWLVVQAACSAVALVGDASAESLLLAWAAGGWASAIYCLAALGVVPLPAGGRSWFRDHGDLAASWTGDELAQQGLLQVLAWTTGAVAGLEAVGAYRGAVQLTGPATVILGGVTFIVLPTAVRRNRAGPKELTRFVQRATPALTAAASLVLLPLLIIPTSVGELLLGPTWEPARRVLPFVIGARIFNVMVRVAAIGLRALQDRHRALTLRLASGMATLGFGTAAAAIWDSMGVAVTTCVVAAAFAPAWLLAFRDGIRKRPKHLRMR